MSIIHPKMIRISVDYENAAEEWWDAARAAPDAPAAIRAILHGAAESVTVPILEAQIIDAWCSRLPGWDTGPEYAAEPLLFQEVNL